MLEIKRKLFLIISICIVTVMMIQSTRHAEAEGVSGNRIEVWIRSFIPSVSSQDHSPLKLKGSWIKAGNKSVLRMLGKCYGGDDRMFSVREIDTSRVETRFQVFWEFEGKEAKFHIHRHPNYGTRVSATKQVDCNTGAVVKSRNSTLVESSFIATQQGNTLKLDGKIGARNELFELPFDLSGLDILKAPAINYHWEVALDVDKGILSLQFSHDTFLNYEFYLREGNGPWKAIWRQEYGTMGLVGLFRNFPGVAESLLWKEHIEHIQPVVVSKREDENGVPVSTPKTIGMPSKDTVERMQTQMDEARRRNPRMSNFILHFFTSGGLKEATRVVEKGWKTVKSWGATVPYDKPNAESAYTVRSSQYCSVLLMEAKELWLECGRRCRANGGKPQWTFKWDGKCGSPLHTRCSCEVAHAG